MVAIDAQYHTVCLTKFYKHGQTVNQNREQSAATGEAHGIALAELVMHIESFRETSDTRPVFSMTDIKKLYSARLQELGFPEEQVHSTRLKLRLLAAISDLRAHTQGREVLLAFDQDIGKALKQVCEQDFDSQALILAKAPKIVRHDIFAQKQIFNRTFSKDCQNESTPSSLTALVSMVLSEPDIKAQTTLTEHPQSQACKAISQLLIYNCTKVNSTKADNVNYSSHHHNRDRETPIPIYLALKIHGETRKRGLIDILHSLEFAYHMTA